MEITRDEKQPLKRWEEVGSDEDKPVFRIVAKWCHVKRETEAGRCKRTCLESQNAPQIEMLGAVSLPSLARGLLYPMHLQRAGEGGEDRQSEARNRRVQARWEALSALLREGSPASRCEGRKGQSGAYSTSVPAPPALRRITLACHLPDMETHGGAGGGGRGAGGRRGEDSHFLIRSSHSVRRPQPPEYVPTKSQPGD